MFFLKKLGCRIFQIAFRAALPQVYAPSKIPAKKVPKSSFAPFEISMKACKFRTKSAESMNTTSQKWQNMRKRNPIRSTPFPS